MWTRLPWSIRYIFVRREDTFDDEPLEFFVHVGVAEGQGGEVGLQHHVVVVRCFEAHAVDEMVEDLLIRPSRKLILPRGNQVGV